MVCPGFRGALGVLWALGMGMDLGGILDPGVFGELHMMIPLGDLHYGGILLPWL
jgi:hypothetical protein